MSENLNRSGMSTPMRTPVPSRPYLATGQAYHTPHNDSQQSHSPHMIQDSHSMSSDHRGVIYGTNIDSHATQANLERFIREFEVAFTFEGGHRILSKKYLEELKALATAEQSAPLLNVSATDIKMFDREMYFQFIYFPAEMISSFDETIKSMFQRMFIDTISSASHEEMLRLRTRREKLMVGITDLDESLILRELSPKHVNRLISFQGIVIRVSDIHPEMKSALFRCMRCGYEKNVILENAKVEQPKECDRCRHKNTMDVQHNLCMFTDKQYIKFQEMPEKVPEGETPQSISIVCYDSNVDQMKPGDRVEIVGIYRAQPVRIQRSRRTTRSIFNTYVDLISSKVIKDNRFTNSIEEERIIFNDDQRREFFRMAQHPNIVDELVRSFAPSIFGNDDVKKGVLCQLFSGAQKKFSQSGRGRFRSDINICLVGDPSTAKSQLLQQVHKIAPRGVYTSGKGSTAVGLTANVRKDPETNEYILESGALVLSDKGICCIDEFDKMDDNSRTILLEAMQQQTISIAKAGIVCSLNSRTAILAAANPVNSRYNPGKSVIENINLPPALLSRFDLIYIMLDKANEVYDTQLAHHILSLYSSNSDRSETMPPFSKTLLTNYITFARQEYFPQLTEESCAKLSEAYVQLRNLNNDKKTITATPRQLESLIRLSEALAKMRLSNTVEPLDVDCAIGLMRTAIKQSATDPRTGLIDMDVIVTDKLCHLLKQHYEANIGKYRKGLSFDTVLGEIGALMSSTENPEMGHNEREKINDHELKEALQVLSSEGIFDLYGPSKTKPSIRLARDLHADK